MDTSRGEKGSRLVQKVRRTALPGKRVSPRLQRGLTDVVRDDLRAVRDVRQEDAKDRL